MGVLLWKYDSSSITAKKAGIDDHDGFVVVQIMIFQQHFFCPASLSGVHIGAVSFVYRACRWWRHKLSNTWQRQKLVLNKGSVPYKSMLGEKSLTWRSSLFLRGEVRMVVTTSSQLSASHFKRYCGSDKCGAVFRSIDDLTACFFMGR